MAADVWPALTAPKHAQASMCVARVAFPIWRPGLRVWRSAPPTLDPALTSTPMSTISLPSLEVCALPFRDVPFHLHRWVLLLLQTAVTAVILDSLKTAIALCSADPYVNHRKYPDATVSVVPDGKCAESLFRPRGTRVRAEV